MANDVSWWFRALKGCQRLSVGSTYCNANELQIVTDCKGCLMGWKWWSMMDAGVSWLLRTLNVVSYWWSMTIHDDSTWLVDHPLNGAWHSAFPQRENHAKDWIVSKAMALPVLLMISYLPKMVVSFSFLTEGLLRELIDHCFVMLVKLNMHPQKLMFQSLHAYWMLSAFYVQVATTVLDTGWQLQPTSCFQAYSLMGGHQLCTIFSEGDWCSLLGTPYFSCPVFGAQGSHLDHCTNQLSIPAKLYLEGHVYWSVMINHSIPRAMVDKHTYDQIWTEWFGISSSNQGASQTIGWQMLSIAGD